MPSTELISDLEEEGNNLLGSLQLDAEDEPIRRGAASRANSVRFDESALQGANLGSHGGRHSGDFGPIRPGSGMGGHQMMERSYSHKSDGRHSSAGHSVHSMHSGVSGRTSSLGLDSTFAMGDHEDDSLLDMEPPPVLYILGSPPSIIRCWLTTNFTSDGLLYAVVCTGSQKSTVDYSLLRDLGLANNIHRDVDGVHRITLPVFLAEARVTQSNSRSASPAPHLPSITASFEVTAMDSQQETPESKKAIRIFIGSHTLRMHGADILLSRNLMTLYGSDRDKLSIPFVRPEDDAVFKHLTTANVVPSKPKLNAAAPEFVASEKSGKGSDRDTKEHDVSGPKSVESGSEGVRSPTAPAVRPAKAETNATTSTASESGEEGGKQAVERPAPQASGKGTSGGTETHRREAGAALRTPWRQTAAGAGDSSTPLSGYQPAARPRNMKVLRPNKASTSSTRTGAAYEQAPAPRSSTEQRRKTQAEGGGQATVGWGGSSKRSISGPALGSWGEGKQISSGQEPGKGSSAARTANNPLGSASAFSWIASNKPKAPPAAAD
ncbi:1935d5a0-c949-416a-82c5-f3749d67dfdb [Thermothielavioides terrestris]|uniref:1935d5a0-c949-416a-82c5-f3749d67dfdb n=1 Tax=Thermothielavioides terrestris TaxID=2587410 RepID=A0A3S4ANY0_9PEZI|nr:1935d5a0-c949-416a-82c5-f3749d67dfdb [Thermothielavioides terrestris]